MKWIILAMMLVGCVAAATSTQENAIKADCSDHQVDMVFVLDASTSVSENNFFIMKNFTKDFLSSFNIDDGPARVGVITYSIEDYLQFNLNSHTNKVDVDNAIDAVPYRMGSTNTADALNTMRTVMFNRTNGDRPNVPNVAILITDGVSNINTRRTVPEAETAQEDGIQIYAIGVGLGYTAELDGIASKPLKQYCFKVDTYSELHTLQNELTTNICTAS